MLVATLTRECGPHPKSCYESPASSTRPWSGYLRVRIARNREPATRWHAEREALNINRDFDPTMWSRPRSCCKSPASSTRALNGYLRVRTARNLGRYQPANRGRQSARYGATPNYWRRLALVNAWNVFTDKCLKCPGDTTLSCRELFARFPVEFLAGR